ncbi:MAG: hypothetical protein EZS28_018863 [Streblomastix strix]|uniref:Uncharacterized protein n=1 Tax=Streblomastix strix TaxID=222440 RepID=A0A5J4VT45_9EUKA|nr:MAG: hypothetical protein EZS28_018858 [Streblomastix strix]KAA6385615.1 MAG: hypothetical protein EZS28_018863 [Streblomastix strix]
MFDGSLSDAVNGSIYYEVYGSDQENPDFYWNITLSNPPSSDTPDKKVLGKGAIIGIVVGVVSFVAVIVIIVIIIIFLFRKV